MIWKDWPYWLKAGTLGVILNFPIFFIFWMLNWSQMSTFPFILIFMRLTLDIIELGLWSVPISIILSVIFGGFFYGVIIGLIIKKLKSKK